jgi:predicted transcriptional regulator YdeE
VAGEDIPASLWAVFTLPEDESEANDLYTDILCRFLPSSGYRRRDALPNLEFFPQDGGEGSIYIPIEEEK